MKTPATITLRRAVADDSDRLWGLRTEAILGIPHGYYQDEDLRFWAARPQFDAFKSIIRDNYYLAALVEGDIIGGGFLDLTQRSVEAVFVRPVSQGSGTGRKLLLALLQEAKNLGWEEVSLSSTLNAANFYRSLGFESIKDSKFRWEDGREMDCVDMKLRL